MSNATRNTARESLLRFDYAPFADEIERKLASRGLSSQRVVEAALGLLDQWGMGRPDLLEIERLLGDFDTDAMAADEPNYVSHAVRVGMAYARALDRIDFATVGLGIAHNIGEVGTPALLARVQARLDAVGQRAVRLYPVDRSRERDPAYLAAYHDVLAAVPGRLLILKGVDKLDNVLSYVLEDLDTHHYACIEDFVVPRLEPIAPRLAAYLGELCGFVRLPEVTERFRRAQGVSG